MFDLTLNISLSNVYQSMKHTLITVIISLFAVLLQFEFR